MRTIEALKRTKIERFPIIPENKIDQKLIHFLAQEFLTGWAWRPGFDENFSVEIGKQTFVLNLEPKTKWRVDSSGHVTFHIPQGMLKLEDPRKAEIDMNQGIVTFFGRDGRYQISKKGAVHTILSPDGKRVLARVELPTNFVAKK